MIVNPKLTIGQQTNNGWRPENKKRHASEETCRKGFSCEEKLKHETRTELHLEYLAARINVVDKDLPKCRACRVRFPDLTEIGVGINAIQTADLRVVDAELARQSAGRVRTRSREYDVRKVKEIEELGRQDQFLHFSKLERLLNTQVDIIDRAISEPVTFHRIALAQQRPVIRYAVAVQVT